MRYMTQKVTDFENNLIIILVIYYSTVYDLEKIRTYVANTLRSNIAYIKKIYSFRDHWRNDIFKVSVMVLAKEEIRQRDVAYLQNVVLTDCAKATNLSKPEIDAIERQYKSDVDLHKKTVDDNSQLNPAPMKSTDNLEQKIFDVLKKYWKADDGGITDWPGFKLVDFQ
uniref:Uncharacterized protein n=1 Tax=Romanomermis culicivorax TaxID=13658 RepID=A0A915IK05_ROMCU